MEYWLCVVDELSDQIGVEFSTEQRETAAGILKSAASVRSDYQSHSEPVSVSPAKERSPERTPAWWEDTSKLCGSDWVLAKQIHQLIGSRYA